MNTKIIELLTQLKLSGISNCIEEILMDAEKNGCATEDVLLELLEAEHRERQTTFLHNRIKNATLPEEWTLDTFPFHQQPSVNKIQIMNLAKLNFIERHENIVFVGNTGAGKSGLAMSLMRQALLNGYRCKFFNAQSLLDELGYLNLSEEKVNMFFKLIDMRYRKKPTIITTNLPFEDWYDVFKQKSLVDALLDRLKHYCIVINIPGKSLRDESTKDESATNKTRQTKTSERRKK